MPILHEIVEVKSIDNENKLELKLDDGSTKIITSENFSNYMPVIGDYINQQLIPFNKIYIIPKKDMDDLKSKGLHPQ